MLLSFLKNQDLIIYSIFNTKKLTKNKYYLENIIEHM